MTSQVYQLVTFRYAPDRGWDMEAESFAGTLSHCLTLLDTLDAATFYVAFVRVYSEGAWKSCDRQGRATRLELADARRSGTSFMPYRIEEWLNSQPATRLESATNLIKGFRQLAELECPAAVAMARELARRVCQGESLSPESFT